ncbi:MAG: alanine racemase [Alphaproteobacteria bacterium]|nr:alanine racemase [Alphaproteobacteria bacterium]
MTVLTRPILEISLKNIVENYRFLRSIAPNAVSAAVVKDDAYGLGADIIVKTLYSETKCRDFFVAHAIEGAKITKLATDIRIYVLQGVGKDNINIFRDNEQLIPVISCPDMLNFWQKNKFDNRKPAIQIETGLNRLGFSENELQNMDFAELNEFSLVMSHLACADEKDHFMNEKQLNNFITLKNKYFPNIPASLSASDGVFLGTDFQFDMVRLGAAMYGINTTPYRNSKMKNVVTIKAPILQIKNLTKGEYVGYSATYKANSNRKIAIVSIGYGDGIPRSLSNIGKVFIPNGNDVSEAPIVGRVSMDNIICDVTCIENILVGDMAYVAADFYTLDDVAQDANTIAYEIMSRVGKNLRFEKIYIR